MVSFTAVKAFNGLVNIVCSIEFGKYSFSTACKLGSICMRDFPFSFRLGATFSLLLDMSIGKWLLSYKPSNVCHVGVGYDFGSLKLRSAELNVPEDNIC